MRNHLYDDIIGLPRPESSRPHMPRADRAKIFSPFAALKGYDQAIKNMERVRVNKPDRFDEEKEIINRKLNLLEKGQPVTVTFFQADPAADGVQGFFQTVQGVVWKIDPVFQKLKINDLEIAFDDILDISGDGLPDVSF